PDVKGRERILRLHAKKIKLSLSVDLAVVAAKTPGFVGADLANIVNEAALLAARQGKEAVETSDFDEAIERVIAGLQKKSRVMNPREKKTVAYHEAGHAINCRAGTRSRSGKQDLDHSKRHCRVGLYAATANRGSLLDDAFGTAGADLRLVGWPRSGGNDFRRCVHRRTERSTEGDGNRPDDGNSVWH